MVAVPSSSLAYMFWTPGQPKAPPVEPGQAVKGDGGSAVIASAKSGTWSPQRWRNYPPLASNGYSDNASTTLFQQGFQPNTWGSSKNVWNGLAANSLKLILMLNLNMFSFSSHSLVITSVCNSLVGTMGTIVSHFPLADSNSGGCSPCTMSSVSTSSRPRRKTTYGEDYRWATFRLNVRRNPWFRCASLSMPERRK